MADIDAAVARTSELGGTVASPVMDVLDLGRMAIAQDPTGASFGLWQDAATGVTTVKDEHGSPFWYELHSTDVDASLAFFAGLVGWEAEPNDMGGGLVYYVLSVPGATDPMQQNAGGMMAQMPCAAEAGTPSVWGAYFNVDDADATGKLARELGGSVVMGPHDIPGVGRAVVLADPQGAIFTAMTPIPPG